MYTPYLLNKLKIINYLKLLQIHKIYLYYRTLVIHTLYSFGVGTTHKWIKPESESCCGKGVSPLSGFSIQLTSGLIYLWATLTATILKNWLFAAFKGLIILTLLTTWKNISYAKCPIVKITKLKITFKKVLKTMGHIRT